MLELQLPVHARRELFVRGGVWELQLQTASFRTQGLPHLLPFEGGDTLGFGNLDDA